LLAAVPESPYGWPAELFRRRSRTAEERGEDSPTGERAHVLAGAGGSILDIGAGTGRASLPLARRGHTVTAVERNPGMLEGLRVETKDLGVTVVRGSWPEVAATVPVHDVALCAHVVYDVGEIGPFLDAMVGHSRCGVVIEMTESHPWSGLTPYYQSLHGLDRPTGPTVADLAAVVEERFGVTPMIERWTRPPDLWFESWEEILTFYGRRLLVLSSRFEELRALLEPVVMEEEGRLIVGGEPRALVTLWWGTSPC
jgi:SAM-dependent methyltransferase